MLNVFNILKYNKIKKACKFQEKVLDFDMSSLDKEICEFAENIYKKNKNKFNKFTNHNNKIGFLASTLYDTGGHTPCIINLTHSMLESEKNILLLSKIKQSQKKAPKAMKKLENYCYLTGVEYNAFNFTDTLIKGYNKLINDLPRVIFLYLAQHDIYSTALVYLLKKNTNTKFIFANHASHFPNLAITLADVILEGGALSTKITNEKRKLFNTKIVGIQSKKEGETKYYSKEELLKIRQSLDIEKNDLMTISGGASYKFFENNKSEYFEMIKKMLIAKKDLKHVIMSNLNKDQEDIINKIFEDKELRKRLIILPLSPDYEKFFQASDLYIDSFPISSALTQVDMMRLKVPSVVKINTQNPEWSFYEYMPPKYPYMFENVKELFSSIIDLLENKEKRDEIVKSNYEFWLQNWELNAYKKNIDKIINEVIND